MIYRITFGFAGSGGWTETHAMLSPQTNPQTLIPLLQDIAAKRAQMLGREWFINAIRISRYSDEAGARQRGSFLYKKTFRNSLQTVAADGEPNVVALLARGSAEPSIVAPQFDANQSQTFLGGPLDICVNDGGQVDTSKGNLLASFNSWKSAVVAAQLGWLARSVLAEDFIQGITTNPQGLVEFTMQAAFIEFLDPGIKYKVRVRQINGGQSPLNGELEVQVNSPTTLATVKPIAYTYEQIGGLMKVYEPVLSFVDYGDLILSDTTAKHKRGRAFLSPPGRAKRRIRA